MRASVATEPGEKGRPNEDWVGATPEVIVLLDGLSSAVGAESGCRHGTPWFVAQLGRRLLVAAGDQKVSLPESLAISVGQVAKLHPECDLADPGSPSATVAILRMTQRNALEYLVLADSTVVLATASGANIVTDDRVDLVARRERDSVLREPIGTKDHKQAVAHLIATQKPLRNRSGGYWVAAGDPAVAEHAFTGATPVAQLVDAALLSDGASRIVDMFEEMSWDDVMAALRGRGPHAVIEEVRAVEATDPDGRRWPRYKTADDATIAYARWQPLSS